MFLTHNHYHNTTMVLALEWVCHFLLHLSTEVHISWFPHQFPLLTSNLPCPLSASFPLIKKQPPNSHGHQHAKDGLCFHESGMNTKEAVLGLQMLHTNGQFYTMPLRPPPLSAYKLGGYNMHKCNACRGLPSGSLMFFSLLQLIWVCTHANGCWYLYNFTRLRKSTEDSDTQIKVVSLDHLTVRKGWEIFGEVNPHLATSTIASHSRGNEKNKFQACFMIYLMYAFLS